MLTKEYVAGLFDGEGCITVGRRRSPIASEVFTAHKIVIQIRLAYKPILELMQQQYGGVLTPYKEYRNPADIVISKKPCYTWVLVREALVQRFLEDIYPLTHEKQSQCWLALEFLAQKHSVKNRWASKDTEAYREEMALRDGFYWALRLAKQELF